MIVGFTAADGCVSVPKVGQKRLQYNLAQKDHCVLDRINSEICGGSRNLSLVKKTKSFIFYVPSDAICDDLARYNIVPRKTATYDLPKLTANELRYFLRGYFYGDGCIYGSGSARVYHIIASSYFAETLSTTLLGLGVVDRCPIYKVKGKKCVQIHFKGSQGALISQFMFADRKMLLLPRKHLVTKLVRCGTPWTDREIAHLLAAGVKEFQESSDRSRLAIEAKLEKLNRRRV